MKHLISLNGDKNQVAFIRGNDGDISISFDIPSKNVYWECVRVGVGNSGGQRVPGYVKDALIKVCEAMEKWENEEQLFFNNKMKLIKTPKSAEVRCKCCGRIYEMTSEEYVNTFCGKFPNMNAITARSVSLCPHCKVGIFDLIRINYE